MWAVVIVFRARIAQRVVYAVGPAQFWQQYAFLVVVTTRTDGAQSAWCLTRCFGAENHRRIVSSADSRVRVARHTRRPSHVANNSVGGNSLPFSSRHCRSVPPERDRCRHSASQLGNAPVQIGVGLPAPRGRALPNGGVPAASTAGGTSFSCTDSTSARQGTVYLLSPIVMSSSRWSETTVRCLRNSRPPESRTRDHAAIPGWSTLPTNESRSVGNRLARRNWYVLRKLLDRARRANRTPDNRFEIPLFPLTGDQALDRLASPDGATGAGGAGVVSTATKRRRWLLHRRHAVPPTHRRHLPTGAARSPSVRSKPDRARRGRHHRCIGSVTPRAPVVCSVKGTWRSPGSLSRPWRT